MNNISKIVFIGEPNVGKTSIIRRAACKEFLVIVGNKSDPGIAENVYYEEGYLRAKQANAMFIETSAMADENILELFEGIARAQSTMFSKKFYDL